MVGRSGSSAGVLPVLFAEEVSVVVLPEDVVVSSLPSRRFIVGRSGSSAGVLLVLFAEELSVVVLPEDAVVSSLPLRRFIVGRSGSSDEVFPVLFAAPASVVVLPDGLLDVLPDVLPEDAVVVSPVLPEGRRFMVGLSGSSVEVVEVLLSDFDAG